MSQSRTPKRARLSCAECRRLKIKCDRVAVALRFVLMGVWQSRYVLSDTESLHRKIEELTLRVRELESGLQAERSLTSSEPHPLLDESLLSIAAPATQEDHSALAEDGPISGFGTLMVAEDGTRMKWLGATAVAAWFLEDGVDEDAAAHQNSEWELDKHILDLCHNFPFGNLLIHDKSKEELYNYVPQDEADAHLLVDRFFNSVGWLYNFVPRQKLHEMVQSMYDPSMQIIGPHKLAVVYMIFALNVLVDQDPKPEWRSSHTYSQLARACLGVETVFGTNATLATVQALSLLSLWYQLADDSGDPSRSWGCLGLTFKVAQSIGLHRDGKNWNLSEEESLDRRRVFWELQALDVWQALGYGRPPSLVKPHFDCPQPFDTEESLGHPPNFHRWKHHYISAIMSVLDHALISNSTTSSTSPHAIILKLDTKIRSCAIPAKLQLKDAAARSQADEMLLLQHYTSMLSKESALMYLHRGFFARAVFDPPHEPLRHKYSHSVLACFTSACQILRWMREVVYPYSHLLNRLFGWWGHAYSSAVTLGGLVVMSPGCNLAEQALREFDAAIEMLNHGTVGPKARRILPALEKLQKKARENYELFRAGKWHPDNKKNPPPPEMPGLGAASLPLASKMHSQPQDFDVSNHPGLWEMEVQPSPPSSRGFSGSISPEDQIALQLPIHTPGPSIPITVDMARPELSIPPEGIAYQRAQRAQSFDDYLRLHRMQDSYMVNTNTQSAPPVTTTLPSFSQHPYQMPPTGHAPATTVAAATPWTGHDQHMVYYDPMSLHQPPPPLDGSVAFEPHDAGGDHYNEVSWQLFVNGLGL
ncbi:SubName: Full=Uncharacterized protein {ECO:0000313/EMBL:CCA67892.1} [Serendipita indica DSM 11827]|nr:SubName: Full=Uncharacterized protein {ECO:0000313/EMBL:CCA67892.1} [Serendipita indica DSM 11827]